MRLKPDQWNEMDSQQQSFYIVIYMVIFIVIILSLLEIALSIETVANLLESRF